MYQVGTKFVMDDGMEFLLVKDDVGDFRLLNLRTFKLSKGVDDEESILVKLRKHGEIYKIIEP